MTNALYRRDALSLERMSDFCARLLGLLARKAGGSRWLGQSVEFDPDFYSRLYPDLRHLRDAKALLSHYLVHGRKERRFPTRTAYLAHLFTKHGDLPEGFDPTIYRDLNQDLAALLQEDWEYAAHYVQFGRVERRRFRRESERGDEAAWPSLVCAEVDDALVAAHLRRHDLMPGRWQQRFDLAQFIFLNADWIGAAPATRIQGMLLFAEQGVDRLAPLNIEDAFDPAFYRANHPVAASLGDADLYRHWLREGVELGFAPNERACTAALIGQGAFPSCFDAEAYRATQAGLADLTRTQLLAHWLDHGLPGGCLDVIRGPDAPSFLAQVGFRALLRHQGSVALRAYDEAIARGGPSSARLHGRAEAARALGQDAAATGDYVAAAREPASSLWSHIHAAEGLAAGDLPAALAQIRASSPRWSRDARWRDTARKLLDQSFTAHREVARAAYRQGLRAQGDAILDDALNQLALDLPLVLPLPAPLPPVPGGAIVMLANLDLPQCVHYRVEQRRQQLERGGWTVRVFGQNETEAFRQALPGASAAIFYRVAAFPDILHAILTARALGLRTFYDVDDLIFDAASYPDPFESFEGQITREDYAELQAGVPLFRFAMSQCDEGLAATPALAEAMAPILRQQRCHLMRNGLDARNDHFLDQPDPPLAEPGDTVTIFYGSGTKAHNRDFNDLIGPALLAILQRHPQVRLLIAGHLKLGPALRACAHQIQTMGFTAEVGDYWEILSGVDINVAVLQPGRVADAKSEIKWLEAATCGIPSVVSGTRTYREILVDGEDALLASTPEEWTRALERLVGDPGLRRRIGLAAREKARQLDASARALADILPPPRPSAPIPAAVRKPLILVSNVFFPPQTIGGATRVVRDNLDHFLDRAGDRFDFAVVASDEGVAPEGRMRIDAYRGMPVVRISTPIEADMDWRPFNPTVGSVFAAALDRLQPDLVHFHCVQRLTASAVEAVQARGLPHLVTVHDGWWISDHQFLLDRDGRVVRTRADTLQASAEGPRDAAARIVRRRRLARLLQGADRILAVSESFAQIYRDAGFARTISVPNGLSPGTVRRRAAGKGPRVRLGHVGGREAHKGAWLIEAVLRTKAFRNLSLTLVDLAQERDHVRHDVWGTTPVRIVGPVPQEEIAALYGELDVLLVPSLWPESFGLVAREAQAFGLWVVASDRGAVGKDIVPGVDGFVIDVASPRDLRAILAEIDQDPARFQVPPPEGRAVRTAADQGDDLLRLYGEILGERRPGPPLRPAPDAEEPACAPRAPAGTGGAWLPRVCASAATASAARAGA
ncbi:glycosyl transferase group 1 [Methylobacterium sp. 4-46]|uniref:glycosyltransferase n=1 Tax=unclassified Methylobacterium TaxID=2615210 RepID=UPI000165CA4E|nr:MULTISPECIES: glycosyltransferase [Methylobacterium]ACA15801.1 glycosyl transferase group 1 [Methylobacterium sp. 4-46]WFT81530.1 glycosyltransferase [Methylobacterium nodulans]